jgi:hypothetical protein
MDSPHFEPRRPLLKQVWKAQRQGQWYLVINGLLPLVEGGCVGRRDVSDGDHSTAA